MPDPSPAESLETAESRLREALDKHGLNHPEVLERLEAYVALLRRAGDTEQTRRLEEQARMLRQRFNAARPPASAATPGGQADPGSAELNLYNGRGKHIATAYGDQLFTPSGKNVGRWDASLEVFLDKNGWYLGKIVEGDRLVAERNWVYRQINFGRASGGDRAGWKHQPDKEPSILPPGYEDALI